MSSDFSPLDPPSPPSMRPTVSASGLDIAALVLAILAPLVGLVLAIVARSFARKRSQTVSGVASAALIVSAVLTGLTVVVLCVVAVAAIPFALAPASQPTLSTEAPPSNQVSAEIVVNAIDANGLALDTKTAALAQEIIAGRLERAEIENSGLYYSGGRFHITFDARAEQTTMDRALEALSAPVAAEIRPVLEAGPCDPVAITVNPIADREISLCAADGTEGFLLGAAEVSGDSIESAIAGEQTTADGASTGVWEIAITFDNEGTQSFANLTTRLAGAGTGLSRLAIVVDGEVISAPSVNSAITAGTVTISGSFTRDTAELLAKQLELASTGIVIQVESMTTVR